ncbi:division/cell wall cluster transcriptional repressor MraZ [Candidatus Kaiserbacteria bacterium]|nr:division/cell wall cluster transcriptional repressor MraZ [Candidatus Kaiserbacteria bacterium]
MVALRPSKNQIITMFLGEYLHTFDTKNRVSIPSRFRKDLGRVVVVTRGLDHCLYVYSRKAWEKEARAYAAEVNGSAARRGLARLFLAGSAEVEVDQSGRVLIPEGLKSFASIGEKVIFAGVADRVEMWEENAWKRYTEGIERDADAYAEKVDAKGVPAAADK